MFWFFLLNDKQIHQKGEKYTFFMWRLSDFLSICLFFFLGFISSSAQFVQRDQRPSKDYPWPGDVYSKTFITPVLHIWEKKYQELRS